MREAPNGISRTIAGTGAAGRTNGSTVAHASYPAMFNNPAGIAVDRFGDVYVADSGNHKIRRIDIRGVVSWFPSSSS